MAWAKLDDQLHAHPKIRRAWKYPPALGLHMLAMSYAAGFKPRGFVPSEFVKQQFGRGRERARAVDVLVDVGLWEPVPGGWEIHDWNVYNPPQPTRRQPRRDPTVTRREPNGDPTVTRREPDGDPTVTRRNTRRPQNARKDAPRAGAPARARAGARPVPLTTPPQPPASGGSDQPPDLLEDVAPLRPAGARRRDRDVFAAQMQTWADAHFPDAVAPDAVSSAVSCLRTRSDAPVTADDVRRFAAGRDVWAAQLGLAAAAEARA